METKRIVISKWQKKKLGKSMEMVVYKTKLPDGKFTSTTRHEVVKPITQNQ